MLSADHTHSTGFLHTPSVSAFSSPTLSAASSPSLPPFSSNSSLASVKSATGLTTASQLAQAPKLHPMQYSQLQHPNNMYAPFYHTAIQHYPAQYQSQLPPPHPQQLVYASASPINSPSSSPTLTAVSTSSFTRTPTQPHTSQPMPPVPALSLEHDSQPKPVANKHQHLAVPPSTPSKHSPTVASGADEPRLQSASEYVASDASDDEPDHSHSSNRVHAPRDGESLVLTSKRKPIPRTLSPEAEMEESDSPSNVSEQDDDDDDDGYSHGSSKKSPYRGSSQHQSQRKGNSNYSAKGSPNSGPVGAPRASKAARSRRGRGRALLGLNIVVTGGRYKGETGLVVRGANGYYSVKFHRPLSELRMQDNTAMKRSSELAPITTQGKRLVLPLPPAQRKLMKAQASAGVSGTAAAIAMNSVQTDADFSSSNRSPRIQPHNSSQKRKGNFPTSSRSTAVYRKREHDSVPADEYDQQSDYSSRSASPALEDASDVEQFQDDRDHDGERRRNWRRQRRSPSSSSSRSSSRSSSPRSRSSAGSESPTQTELLSPSVPHSPTVSFSTSHTPLSHSLSIPTSPSLHHASANQYLTPMDLPPAHSVLGGKDVLVTKSASMRAQSPRLKQAASILLALSSEGFHEESGSQPLEVTYSLTHIKPSTEPFEGTLHSGIPDARKTTWMRV